MSHKICMYSVHSVVQYSETSGILIAFISMNGKK